jgi:hypothetical protein
MVRGGSSGGPRWSTGGFGRKIIAQIVSEDRMKNTPVHVCAENAFVG